MTPSPPHVVHIGFSPRNSRLLRAGHRSTLLLDENTAAALPADVRGRFAAVGPLKVPDRADLDNYDGAFDQMTHWVAEFTATLGAPAAVVGLSEESVLPAARLRGRLGLPGMTTDTARLLRDKVRMKEAVRGAGVDTPAFVPVGPRTTEGEAARIAGLMPGGVVLKPRSQAAAMGVEVFDDPGRFVERVRRGGVGEGFEAEEFVTGDLCHVDGLVRDGRVLFVTAAAYLAAPYDVVTEGGHPLGSIGVDDPRMLARMTDHTATALDALGLRDGVFHLELFVRPDGRLTFLEVAARPGGGGIADHIRYVYGVDLAEEALRVCLNEPPSHTGPPTALDTGIAASGWLFSLTPEGGDRTVARVDGAESLPASVVRHTVARPGDEVTESGEMYRAQGQFTFIGDSARQLTEDALRVWSDYHVTYR
ncbi:hypothetical protein G3I19_22965 [Streptomyces sp. SID10853]|uniref:ATP-grasp domain-containing protein n=1 Tax=Streptomyces sp. SID10853 TaxID=2706028 RepID=UPI0013BEDAC4|nr:hypothetical protein [Streptomyces sp. SID10853]NDZ81340.1 hypothetical protein [Streptomyces sp. SID10853]